MSASGWLQTSAYEKNQTTGAYWGMIGFRGEAIEVGQEKCGPKNLPRMRITHKTVMRVKKA